MSQDANFILSASLWYSNLLNHDGYHYNHCAIERLSALTLQYILVSLHADCITAAPATTVEFFVLAAVSLFTNIGSISNGATFLIFMSYSVDFSAEMFSCGSDNNLKKNALI